MLNFLDFNLYKIGSALASLNNSAKKNHKLAKYVEKYKDKTVKAMTRNVQKLKQFVQALPLERVLYKLISDYL